jgi:hypothetical protein
MKYRLFTIFTAVSFGVWVAATVFWVRSFFIQDNFAWRRPWHCFYFSSGGGQFRFEHTRPDPNWPDSYWPITDPGFEHSTDQVDGPVQLGQRMPGSRQYFRGFGFWLVTGERWGDYHHALFVPAWFVSALTLVLPGVAGLRMIRSRKITGAQICRRCGYDLRATPERCPECGVVPAGQEAA